MRNRLFTLAGALALLAVLGKFYVPPLLAQARAALVKNVDEPGRSPYQAVAISSMACGTNGYNTFPAVPAGKRLVITFVSGELDLSMSSPLVYASVHTSPVPVSSCGGVTLLSGPTAGLPFLPQSNGVSQFSGPIQFYVEEGNSPVVVASAPLSNFGVQFVNFTVVGYLIDKAM